VKIIAFSVVNPEYIDPAIIAINSFCKFNPALRLRVYVEAGTNISRLRAAVGHYRAEFRETEFPELPEHESMGDSLSGLFYRPAALPSFAQRIRGLEELRQEGAEIIVNLDLDTLTCGNITPALRHASPESVLGVSERANRSRWQKNLGLCDDAATLPRYINTGFAIYGADTLGDDLLLRYRKFLRENPGAKCPEQDFLNRELAANIRLLPPAYNLMFTDPEYRNVAPRIIHYIGSGKPWAELPVPFPARYYLRRYRSEARKLEGYLSESFLRRLDLNADTV
jgi:lipopolysaccharide biosynthesis glycosyltransferase